MNAKDCSNWTPLHIACFMGNARKNVVKLLLSFKADPNLRNSKGQQPRDLCDCARTRDLLDEYKFSKNFHDLVRPTPESTNESTSNSNIISHVVMSPQKDSRLEASPSCENEQDVQIEPFFVPQVAEISFLAENHKNILSNIGIDFFNSNPGHGLAFLVSSNCITDSPQPLLNHLLNGTKVRADSVVFGDFLGETYSLSQILRLECMNSLDFEHTGIVEALRLVGQKLSWPADFEKLDRLTFCCALMWWRKHEEGDSRSSSPKFKKVRNFDGYNLKKHLGKKQEVHQLMFALLILHMNLHGCMKINQNSNSQNSQQNCGMGLTDWIKFCRGLVNLPESFLIQFYYDVQKYDPNLVVRKCNSKYLTSIKQQIYPRSLDVSGQGIGSQTKIEILKWLKKSQMEKKVSNLNFFNFFCDLGFSDTVLGFRVNGFQTPF